MYVRSTANKIRTSLPFSVQFSSGKGKGREESKTALMREQSGEQKWEIIGLGSVEAQYSAKLNLQSQSPFSLLSYVCEKVKEGKNMFEKRVTR